jgi:iron uptake system component EfeO
MIKLRQAAVGIAILALIAGCNGTANPAPVATTLPPQDSGAPDASMPLAADSVAVYRTYLETNADLLVQRTKPFTDAIVAGKVAAAKALYAPAREPYERIEPAAAAFGDLDPAIDALETDVPAGATFTGFHRLERALWLQNTTTGVVPIARKLQADVIKLQALVRTVDLDPATIANGAVGLLSAITATKMTGGEDRYAHTDLWDLEANILGAQAAYNSVRPLVVPRAAALAATIDADFAAVLAALQPYQKGTGYVPFTALSPADAQAIGGLIDALADPLSQVGAIVVTAQ